jgi:hypothetical protein
MGLQCLTSTVGGLGQSCAALLAELRIGVVSFARTFVAGPVGWPAVKPLRRHIGCNDSRKDRNDTSADEHHDRRDEPPEIRLRRELSIPDQRHVYDTHRRRNASVALLRHSTTCIVVPGSMTAMSTIDRNINMLRALPSSASANARYARWFSRPLGALPRARSRSRRWRCSTVV